MEGLIIPTIFFVTVLLLYVYLIHRISTMKTDLKYLEKEIIIKLTFLNNLHTGLQTEVTTHRARERTLDRHLLKFLEANEDLFKDDISFQTLSDLLKREV